jgi:RNase H-fold protein (predicted Holliday junction resolvase)
MDGSDSQMSVLAGELAKKLETLGIAGIFLFDERRTSVHAMQFSIAWVLQKKRAKEGKIPLLPRLSNQASWKSKEH